MSVYDYVIKPLIWRIALWEDKIGPPKDPVKHAARLVKHINEFYEELLREKKAKD